MWFNYLSCESQQEMLGSGWSRPESLVLCTSGERAQMGSETAERAQRAAPCGNVKHSVSCFGSGEELRKLKAE